MAIPMIRALISQSQSLSHSLIQSLPRTLSSIDESSSRRKRLLCSAPSELNPAR
jgi:hypothetical protein